MIYGWSLIWMMRFPWISGQMSRKASSRNKNQLDLIIRDQMTFSSPPGAGVKMISLFMTVTWWLKLIGFSFFSCLWGFTQMGHRLQGSFHCRKAVIWDWDRHEPKVPRMSGLSEEWPYHLQEVPRLRLCLYLRRCFGWWAIDVLCF